MVRNKRWWFARLVSLLALLLAITGSTTGTRGTSVSSPVAVGVQVAPSIAVPTQAIVKVARMGDSLTWGWGSSDTYGYKTELGRLLSNAGMTVTWAEPDHGYNGGTVQSMVASMDTGWSAQLAADAPDLLILNVGTHNAAGDPPGMSGFKASYQSLLNKIHAASPSTRVIASRLFYSRAFWSIYEVSVNQSVIETYLTAPWSSYVIPAQTDTMNPCSLLYEEPGDSGVHPRDAGYGYMARELYRAIQPLYGLQDIPREAYTVELIRRPGIERQPTGC